MTVEVIAMDDRTYRPADGYLTMTAAANHLGVSLVTMRKILRDAGIRAYRDPRNKRVRLLKTEDVEQLIQPVPEDLEGNARAA